MIKINRNYRNYIGFVHKKPQGIIVEFLKGIGAEEVPRTKGMLWELPKLSKTTIERCFRHLVNEEPPADPAEMLKMIDVAIKRGIDWRTAKLPPNLRRSMPQCKQEFYVSYKK